MPLAVGFVPVKHRAATLNGCPQLTAFGETRPALLNQRNPLIGEIVIDLVARPDDALPAKQAHGQIHRQWFKPKHVTRLKQVEGKTLVTIRSGHVERSEDTCGCVACPPGMKAKSCPRRLNLSASSS